MNNNFIGTAHAGRTVGEPLRAAHAGRTVGEPLRAAHASRNVGETAAGGAAPCI